MTKLVRLAGGLLILFAAGICAAAVSTRFTPKERAQGYVDSVVLAKPRADRASVTAAAEASEGTALLRHFPRLRGIRALRTRSGESVDQAIARLRATGRYEFVERDTLRFARAVPNDPSFPQQWSLRNTGQNGGVAGADIGATAAWGTQNDASSVIVAIIDSGARLTHLDLAPNLWTSSTGTHGINATVSSGTSSYNIPTDTDGHGTHVAGIIGAAGNNGIGTAGVAWRTQLMPLKFLTEDGGALSDELECIQYAIDHGAKVINASFGGGPYSLSELNALAAARDAGIIVVVAAGNDAVNNDVVTDYPSGYPLDNIVAVAATDRTDALDPSYSNYGPGSVELGAPGTDIYSTYNGSDTSYTTLTGTSMAAPHVTGAIALLRAKFPGDTYRQIINRLLRSVTKLPSLDGQVQSGGRLNLAAALASTSNRPFNDDFAARAVLDGSTIHVRSNNVGATSEPGEPAHAGVANTNSLWWSWTASASANVKIATTGSAYDTVLALYTGNSLGALAPVASNDDSGGTASSISFSAQAGTTYQIAVAGKAGASGYTALAITEPPPNDDFATAQTVAGPSFSTKGTTLNSGAEPGEPDPSGQAAGHSVWYRWTAPASGRYLLAAFATQIDTVAAVYTGSSLSSLSVVAFDDNSLANSDNSDALVPFTASAGTVYYFQVDNNTDDGSNGGDFVLTLADAAWEYPVKDEVTSSPAVGADGTIYFGAGSDNGYDRAVYAINADGTKKWSFNTSSTGDGIMDASPAIGADGTVYIGSTDQNLYALNGTTGAKKWSFRVSSELISTPAIASDGTIYFRDNTQLHALTDGGSSATQKWSFTLNNSSVGGTYSSPAIGADGTIYVGTTGGNLFALTPAGAQKWKFTADDAGDIYTSPAIAADGTIYVATLNGHVYAVSSSGTKLWSWGNTDQSSITSSIALGGDGTLYFAGYDHKLHALTRNGSERWSFTLGDEVRASSPAVAADGTIYVGCYDGLIYAVNPDGTLRRTYATAQTIRSSPAIANQRLYIGSADAKLYALDLGQSAANSAWPMFQQNSAHTARAIAPTGIIVQPSNQSAAIGGTVTLSVTASGSPAPAYQWQRNATDLPGATGSTLTLSNLQPADAAVYTVKVTTGTTATSTPAIVGVTTTDRAAGAAQVLHTHVLHPNGNYYDQVLLTGPAAAITAAPGSATRISYVDLNDEIVQVEFSGHGTLALALEDSSGPAPPVNYHQPGVAYMKGHAHIVISGADETTNVTVFSVGRYTAWDPTNTFDFLQPISPTNVPASNRSPLFQDHGATNYAGFADLASIAIASTDGKFGSLHSANADYFAQQGYTGIIAPGVQFNGEVYLYDLSAHDTAVPVILLGSAATTLVTGGSLEQFNSSPVEVSGITRLKFVAGVDSEGRTLPAQPNQARLDQDGADVTAAVVANPP